MSLFYNRDRNINLPSTLQSIDFAPSYGSMISFSCKKNIIPYKNYTFNIIPTTVNSITAECSFIFNKERSSAQKIIDFLESQSGTGFFAINDTSNIYRTLTGFAEDFDITMQNNNSYNINMRFIVDRNASPLQWKGMAFVNYDYQEWRLGQTYKKYQPVYFEVNSNDKTRNFFYATSDHVSSNSNAPFAQNTAWTQSLFYENDFGLGVKTMPKVDKNFFKNSFSDRIKVNENIHLIEKLQLNYANISDFKLKSILHFLENSLGYKRFEFNLPQIYNKRKIFYVDEWQHTWKYKDSNDLTISLMEDPLGIINPNDTPQFIIRQTSLDNSINISATGQNNGIFVVDFTGVKSGNNILNPYNFNWGAYTDRQVKFYRNIDRVSSTNTLKSIYFKNCNIGTGIFRITGDISFENDTKIHTLNLNNSTIQNLDLSNVTGIQNILANTTTIQSVSLNNIQNIKTLNFGASPLNADSIFNIVKNASNQQLTSGTLISSQGNYNPSQDLVYFNNLDYYSWNLSIKNFVISPTTVGQGITQSVRNLDNYYWFQSQQASLNYNLNWQANGAGLPSLSHTLTQAYSPQKESWFYPDINNKIGQRQTYKLNNTLLQGTRLTNINANTFGCFGVAKFNNTGLMCLVNFDFTKKYGLFTRETGLYFIDSATETLIASGLSPNTYYHFAFTRSPTNYTGFVNGQATNSGSIANNTNTYLEISVGSASGGNFLQGNFADLLVGGNNINNGVAVNISQSDLFFRSYCAKYGIQALPIV